VILDSHCFPLGRGKAPAAYAGAFMWMGVLPAPAEGLGGLNRAQVRGRARRQRAIQMTGACRYDERLQLLGVGLELLGSGAGEPLGQFLREAVLPCDVGPQGAETLGRQVLLQLTNLGLRLAQLGPAVAGLLAELLELLLGPGRDFALLVLALVFIGLVFIGLALFGLILFRLVVSLRLVRRSLVLLALGAGRLGPRGIRGLLLSLRRLAISRIGRSEIDVLRPLLELHRGAVAEGLGDLSGGPVAHSVSHCVPPGHVSRAPSRGAQLVSFLRKYFRHLLRAALPPRPAVTRGHSWPYSRFRLNRGSSAYCSSEKTGTAMQLQLSW